MGNKLFKVVCPTEDTKQYLIDQKIFNEKKVFVLKDPIINISSINHLKNININEKKIKKEKYILSIGRLTKQKNFLFLIKCFNIINKETWIRKSYISSPVGVPVDHRAGRVLELVHGLHQPIDHHTIGL